MDLSAMQDNRASRPKGFQKGNRGFKGKSQENDRRRRANLCYTCGKPGHRARECQTAQGLHMMSDGTAGMEETKADTSMKTQMVADDQGRKAQKDHHKSDAQGAGESEDEQVISKGNLYAREVVHETYGADPLEAQIFDAYDKACQENETPKDEPINYAAGFNYLNAAEKHATLSWTACYDDSCTIHYSDKVGTGWFPQGQKRRNQRSNKSKRLQEALSEKGDLHNEPGFWMMGDDDTTPVTLEKTKFIAISMTREKLVIVSPHWRTIPCWRNPCPWTFTHQHRVFDPSQPEQAPCMIEIIICQGKECAVEGTHAHQGPRDEDVIPLEIPSEALQQLRGVTGTTTLSMMNQEDPDDVELPLAEKEDHNNNLTFTYNVHSCGCTLVTTQWVKLPCEGFHCKEEAQHAHIYYDSEAEPKKQAKRIRLTFCKDPEYEDKENIHYYSTGRNDTIDISISTAKEQEIR